jgi:hypothetical protein
MTTTTDGTRTIGGTNWAQDGMSAIWTSPAVTGRERDLLRASVWTSGGTVALQLQIGRRDIDDDEPDDDLSVPRDRPPRRGGHSRTRRHLRHGPRQDQRRPAMTRQRTVDLVIPGSIRRVHVEYDFEIFEYQCGRCGHRGETRSECRTSRCKSCNRTCVLSQAADAGENVTPRRGR